MRSQCFPTGSTRPGPGYKTGAGLLLSLLILLWVTGCGFKLRGQVQLPPDMEVIYIKSQQPVGVPPSSVARNLARTLEANDITVTSDPAQAKLILEILHEGLRRRTLATGPSGEDREYTLNYDVHYRAVKADGTVLIPRETLTTTRDLLYDEADVLGKAEGEEIAIQSMVNDLSRTIIRHLQAVTT